MIMRPLLTSFIICLTTTLFGQWENAVLEPITENSRQNEANRQSLKIDQQQTIHLIWEEIIGQEGAILFYARRPADGSWSTPETVLPEGEAVFSSALELDNATGTPYVIAQVGRLEESELILSRRNSEGIWIQRPLTNSLDIVDLSPAIAIDQQSRIHLSWVSQTEAGAFTIKYAILDQFLSNLNEEIIEASVPGSNAENALPQLAISSQGAAHISYRGTRTNQFRILYAHNTGPGTPWTVETVPSNNIEDFEHAIGLFSDTIINIVSGGVSSFNDQWRINHRTRNVSEIEWTLPRTIVGSNRGTLGAYFLDSDGVSHCLVDGLENGIPQGVVYYARNEQGFWRSDRLAGNGDLISVDVRSGQLLLDDQGNGYASIFTLPRNMENSSEVAVLGPQGNTVTSINPFRYPMSIHTHLDKFHQQLTISWETKEGGNFQLSLGDIQGKILQQLQLNATTGVNEVRLPVSQLNTGMYFMFIQSRTQTSTVKIFVEKN